MQSLSDKKLELEALRRELAEKQKDCDNWEIELNESEFDEMLDDVFGKARIAGFEYDTGYALKNLDPVAYRCAKNDYEAGMELEEDPAYRDLQEEIEDLETDIERLEEEIEEEAGADGGDNV